jgi:hypothetical protein
MDISQKKTLSLDHVLVSVQDYEQTRDNYCRMGFAPTPVSYHPWGTETCFVMFDDNFIELLGIHDASKFGTNAVNGFCFGRQIGSFLDKGEDGIALIALHSKDARTDYAELIKAHSHHQGLIDFRRKIELEDGRIDEVVVTIGLLIDPEYPESSGFICQQFRPDLIWVDEWKQHPNGATQIAAVTYIANDVSLLQQRWQIDYGDTVTSQHGVVSVDTQSGVLRAMSADQFAALYAGIDMPISTNSGPHAAALTLETRSLADLIAILQHNNVLHDASPERVLVSPTVTGNIIFEFVQFTR